MRLGPARSLLASVSACRPFFTSPSKKYLHLLSPLSRLRERDGVRGGLLRFLVVRVFAATRAVLRELKLVRRRALVLVGAVVPLLALGALELEDDAIPA